MHQAWEFALDSAVPAELHTGRGSALLVPGWVFRRRSGLACVDVLASGRPIRWTRGACPVWTSTSTVGGMQTSRLRWPPHATAIASRRAWRRRSLREQTHTDWTCAIRDDHCTPDRYEGMVSVLDGDLASASHGPHAGRLPRSQAAVAGNARATPHRRSREKPPAR